MEIQLYKALLEAGVKDETASNLVDSFERELRERLRETRTDLATKADLTETKADIIKWNVGAILAAAGLAVAIARLVP